MGPRSVADFDTRGSERRGDVMVDDIAFDGRDGLPVEAFLVRPTPAITDPAAAGPASAGVVWWHWFDPEADDGDRTEFVDEAVERATTDGIVSLLPQGRFPWSQDPTGAAADVAAVEAEAGRVRDGLDLLAALPAVDPRRLGLVGHDFGGMLAAIAAARDGRVGAVVLVAATPRWGDWFLPFWPIKDDRIDYLRAMRTVDPIEWIGRVAPAEVLLQVGTDDFFIAAMTAREFQRAAPDGSILTAYATDHAMRSPEIRADRAAFLRRTLVARVSMTDAG